jgi:AcrR family transcriptional regulator
VDVTKERILSAAGEVFASKGFEAATVREICTKAEANIAAVNYHFGSKESLYLQSVQAAHCHRMNDEQAFGPEFATLTAEAKLRGFIGLMMQDMWDHDRPGWQHEILMREMAHPTHACVELVRNLIGPKFELLHSILREFLPNASDRRLHLTAFSIVGQCLLYRFHRPIGRLLVGDEEYGSYKVEELADHVASFCIHALKSMAAAESAS